MDDASETLDVKKYPKLFEFSPGIGHKIKNKRLKRKLNNLIWRQTYQDSDIYPIEIHSGKVLNISQIINGEIKGLGTGGMLASCVVRL